MTARKVVRRSKTTEQRTPRRKLKPKAIAPAIEVVKLKPNHTPTEETFVVHLGKYSTTDSTDPGRWTLTIEDKSAGVRILDMNITPEQFTEMFSGQAVVTGRFFRNQEIIGTVYDTQAVDIDFDHTQWAKRYEIANAALEELFPGEGWQAGGVPIRADKAPVIVKTTGKLQVWAFRYIKEKQA